MIARKARRVAGVVLVCLGWALVLGGCNNQYGPPPADGKPRNWGQQHYLDVQRWREQGPMWRND